MPHQPSTPPPAEASSDDHEVDRRSAERDTAPGEPGGGDDDAMERADRANGEPDAADE